MKKLEEIRDKKANSFNPYRQEIETLSHIYNAGFDAAIGLDLPVLFADWKENVSHTQAKKMGLKKDASNKDLYHYWLNNIYQPNLEG